jgi:hypothetical protein
MRVSNEQVKAEITCHAGNCGGCPFEGIDHCENNRCNDANAYLDLKEAREIIKEMRKGINYMAVNSGGAFMLAKVTELLEKSKDYV